MSHAGAHNAGDVASTSSTAVSKASDIRRPIRAANPSCYGSAPLLSTASPVAIVDCGRCGAEW